MRTSQLKYLVAIADCGSFRSAARRLQCAQPTLTKSIAQLEGDVGFRIFERTRAGVVQTERGARVVNRARQVLAEMRRLDAELASDNAAATGMIRLGVSPAIELGILPGVVTRFQKEWPGYQLVISGSLYPQGLQDLREGLLDVLIGPLPHEPVGGQLSVETLFDTSTIVVARPDHPRIGARHLADIVNAAWLIHGPSEGPSSLYAEAFRAAGLPPPIATLRSHSLAFTLAMLRQSDCFCVLSDQLLSRIERDHGLSRVPIEEHLPSRTLALMLRDRILDDPAVATLIRLLRVYSVRMPAAIDR